MSRTLYHDCGCRYVDIRPTDKSECGQCQGNGLQRDDHSTCRTCNGHGWVWDSRGYAFQPYTLKAVYN